MRFIGYSVENYKSIEDKVKLVPLETLNCLIGPNNEGKSSLLEPLSLLKYLTTPIGSSGADPEDFVHSRLSKKSEDKRFRLTLEFEYTESDVNPGQGSNSQGMGSISYTMTWGTQIEGSDRQHLNAEAAWVNPYDAGTGPIPVLLRAEDSTNFVLMYSGLSEILAGNYRSGTETPSDVTNRLVPPDPPQDINSHLGLMRFLTTWSSRFVYVPSHREVNSIGKIDANVLQIDRTSIPALIHKMRNNNEPQFREFEELVTKLIGSIKQIHTYIETGNRVSIRISPEKGIPAEQAYRLDTAGSGVQELLYLASSIWLSPENSVIIIDEPERGLHPGSQRTLLRASMEHARVMNKQIFWTTHSTVMAPLIPDCSVYLVGFSPTKVTTVSPVKEDASPILESIGQRMVDIYNYDLIVLYDGYTEDNAIPPIADEILGSEAVRGINFFNLKGDVASKKELVGALIRLLTGSHTQLFILADDDEGVKKAIDDLLKEFDENSVLGGENVHTWDCGIRAAKGRGAEFEDNFKIEELILAANDLAGSSKLKLDEFSSLLDEKPTVPVSKLLQEYYYRIFEETLSKPDLGVYLGKVAVDEIRKRGLSDQNARRYEFESVIERFGMLLSPKTVD